LDTNGFSRNPWIPLFGVFLDGVLGLSGSIVVKLLENRRERRVLAYALAGEITAILEIVRVREYVRNTAEYIAQAENHKNSTVTMLVRIE
jgi:hypothetical protein